MDAIRRCRTDDYTAMAEIINEAAQKYRGVIPDDCWHEPYMPAAALAGEIAAGVVFWGIEAGGRLAGIMGVQDRGEVELIRHAYVLPGAQGRGIGGRLLRHLCDRGERPVLVGTWAAADWAIGFYRRHGFSLLDGAAAAALLARYWTVSDRQAEVSVVLANR